MNTHDIFKKQTVQVIDHYIATSQYQEGVRYIKAYVAFIADSMEKASQHNPYTAQRWMSVQELILQKEQELLRAWALEFPLSYAVYVERGGK